MEKDLNINEYRRKKNSPPVITVLILICGLNLSLSPAGGTILNGEGEAAGTQDFLTNKGE